MCTHLLSQALMRCTPTRPGQWSGILNPVFVRSADLGDHHRRFHICICMRLPLVHTPREPSRPARSLSGGSQQVLQSQPDTGSSSEGVDPMRALF